jgi:hypothetical protein
VNRVRQGKDWAQQLASAVILQALDDLERGGEWAREDAAQFLAGGPDLEFWCSIAGVSIDAVRRGSKVCCWSRLKS